VNPIFYGTATDKGIVVMDTPVAFRKHITRLAGKPIEVVVRRRKSARSLKANAYYFGVVIATIAPELGYTKDECHEALAWHLLQCGDPDAKLPKRKSTADLTSHEFEDYVSQVKQFAAEKLGIYVPDPNEIDLG
jgi:hypothetical protein